MKLNFTVRQGALDGVEAFLSVARHRNFRSAAAELGVTPSAISQAVRALETRVGAALFIRTTRSVGLTEAGERFLARAKPAFEELVAAGEAARDLGNGRPDCCASRCRARWCRFAGAADRIVLPGLSRDRGGDRRQPGAGRPRRGGFDAGIRLGQFIAPDMVVVRLTPPFPFVVVGSPDYLRRRKRPERIDDLQRHACLRMRRSNGSIAPWAFVDGNKAVEAMVSGPLIAHDYPTLLGAAIQGVGLAQVPGPVAKDGDRRGAVAGAADAFAVMTPGVFLYYPGNARSCPSCGRSSST